MGTTLANIHILNGNEKQINELLPKATVGQWSKRFVSVFSPEFIPGPATVKSAKTLSKKLTQLVFLSWIVDSDAVGFFVYKGGKTITEHFMNPNGDVVKMGNIPLFCKSLDLADEDEKRLRFIWKKGDAEDKIYLTALLLGLPLYNDCEMLPDKSCSRNSDIVDKWISERPTPPKVKSETKAILIKEELSSNGYADILTNIGKITLSDGGILACNNNNCEFVLYTRYNKDGKELWNKKINRLVHMGNLFAASDDEIVFASSDTIERFDSLTGEIIEELPSPFGHNTWSKVYHAGYWWVAHHRARNNVLTKLDGGFHILAEIPLPKYTQGLYFSLDNKYIYVSICKEQIMVVDTETLAVENVLKDKSVLIPNGFDCQGRFWLQRDFSTAEAWDMLLTKTLSRHKLKGNIIRWWTDEDGIMHAATYKDVSMSEPYPFLNRVYRFE